MEWLFDQAPRIISSSFYILIFSWIENVAVKGWRARRNCTNLKRQGLPMPKHNTIFGHLLSMKPIIDRLPSDVHPFIYFGQLAIFRTDTTSWTCGHSLDLF
ncbi:hypothetical protein OCU04_003417 [Sclerotinia nivalis]|uniref:Uncharacterized protein n=1 Tax=Sclerotinia nivalis TaxID=352851 RepID=A0A9X0ARV6_9HELO|nr:hypothetical protein OCU04_003417 [Sclerotinia nivalis]